MTLFFFFGKYHKTHLLILKKKDEFVKIIKFKYIQLNELQVLLFGMNESWR